MAPSEREIRSVLDRYGHLMVLGGGLYSLYRADRTLHIRLTPWDESDLGYVQCDHYRRRRHLVTRPHPLGQDVVWFSTDSPYELELALVYQTLRPYVP